MVFKRFYNVRIISVSIALLLTAISILSCSPGSNPKNDEIKKEVIDGVPEITFDTLFYDFGNLIEGEKVAFTFKYKNTGTADLLIFDVYSTCGCTIPSFSKEPVSPGKEGKIEVLFDSANRSGLQNKTITLKLNTPEGEKSLWIKANVKSNNN
jgi:hypothetical protein